MKTSITLITSILFFVLGGTAFAQQKTDIQQPSDTKSVRQQPVYNSGTKTENDAYLEIQKMKHEEWLKERAIEKEWLEKAYGKKEGKGFKETDNRQLVPAPEVSDKGEQQKAGIKNENDKTKKH